MTQKELAEKVGRERTYINQIEQGETDLQLSSFIRITDALGINISVTKNDSLKQTPQPHPETAGFARLNLT